MDGRPSALLPRVAFCTAVAAAIVGCAEEGLPAEGDTFTVPGMGITMTWVAPGEFRMGSEPTEPGHEEDEMPVDVTLTHGFWLGSTEITVGQWRQFVEASGFSAANSEDGIYIRTENGWHQFAERNWFDPGFLQTDSHPVVGISWEDAVAFCDWLSARERAADRLPAGCRFGLPSEAQWEYACRAGSTTPYAFGPTLTTSEANFKSGKEGGKSRGGTTPVGSFAPNAWGFFDMHGNVWELCADTHGEYPEGPLVDPLPASDGEERVRRGGSWVGVGINCRSANRNQNTADYRANHLGFRVALVLGSSID